MGRVTTGKTCNVTLIIYKTLKNFNELEQQFNDNNECTISVMREAVIHALLTEGKVQIMGNFSCEKTDWENLDSRRQSHNKTQVLKSVSWKISSISMSLNILKLEANTLSLLDLISTYHNMAIEISDRMYQLEK